jgi:hypothetical protein
MRKEFHTRHSTIAVAAFVMALALPVAVPLTRDGGEATAAAAAEGAVAKGPVAAVVTPPARFVIPASDDSPDPVQAGSMLLVGTLLIGIGSVVRRAL